jgi:hypothetical protein
MQHIAYLAQLDSATLLSLDLELGNLGLKSLEGGGRLGLLRNIATSSSRDLIQRLNKYIS